MIRLSPVVGRGVDPVLALAYLHTGEMKSVVSDPADVTKGKYQADITALNLNADRLIRSRKAAYPALTRHVSKIGWPNEIQRTWRALDFAQSSAKWPPFIAFQRYWLQHFAKKTRHQALKRMNALAPTAWSWTPPRSGWSATQRPITCDASS